MAFTGFMLNSLFMSQMDYTYGADMSSRWDSKDVLEIAFLSEIPSRWDSKDVLELAFLSEIPSRWDSKDALETEMCAVQSSESHRDGIFDSTTSA